jgi:hypothetical protein
MQSPIFDIEEVENPRVVVPSLQSRPDDGIFYQYSVVRLLDMLDNSYVVFGFTVQVRVEMLGFELEDAIVRSL